MQVRPYLGQPGMARERARQLGTNQPSPVTPGTASETREGTQERNTNGARGATWAPSQPDTITDHSEGIRS